ncbi:MAG: translation elongation factor EF-1 subunit alpha [Candidatus Asgardarchaeia archaeon]
MPKEKPHLNLVVIGHVDHGKSTTMGHVLYLTGAIDERKIRELEKEAEEKKDKSFMFAFVMDTLKEERLRGLTIDLAFKKFETPKNYFTLIDAPGHADFIKNMITGASQADAAILVVSARPGEFEAGISLGGQTREHAYLAYVLGVNQLVVAVNKMDATQPPYSKERYEEIVAEMKKLLSRVGYKVDKIRFVPISGLKGDNLVEKSPNMPWYDGPTLIEALDEFVPPPKPLDKPLRIPIENVYTITGVGTVPVGRVETGVLKVGDTVVFLPPRISGEVKSIEMHHEPIERAEPGDNIGFNVRGVSRKDIKRGDVACHPDSPAPVVSEFIAQIQVIYWPGRRRGSGIVAGYTPVLHIHTARAATRFVELISKTVRTESGTQKIDNPKILNVGDVAVVRLAPLEPIVVEKFREISKLGRFAIRDMGRTVAVGVVTEITKTVNK